MDTNLERNRAAVAEDDAERVTSAPAPGSRDAGVSMTICWPVLRAGDDRKTIKSREGAAMRARCVFWRDSEVRWWEGRSSRILSIYEAPLANNSTNKQREPPLLAFVDKKKGAPPKPCDAAFVTNSGRRMTKRVATD